MYVGSLHLSTYLLSFFFLFYYELSFYQNGVRCSMRGIKFQTQNCPLFTLFNFTNISKKVSTTRSRITNELYYLI